MGQVSERTEKGTQDPGQKVWEAFNATKKGNLNLSLWRKQNQALEEPSGHSRECKGPGVGGESRDQEARKEMGKGQAVTRACFEFPSFCVFLCITHLRCEAWSDQARHEITAQSP